MPGLTADLPQAKPQVATEPERQPEQSSGAQGCRWCGGPLSGAQTHYDSATCKAKQNAFEHSLDRLASLPEAEFREALRSVCLTRYFTPWKRGGRLHIRWGEYKESQEKTDLELALWRDVVRDADSGIKRIVYSMPNLWFVPRHTQREGWTASALRIIARMLDRRERASGVVRSGQPRGVRPPGTPSPTEEGSADAVPAYHQGQGEI